MGSSFGGFASLASRFTGMSTGLAGGSTEFVGFPYFTGISISFYKFGLIGPFPLAKDGKVPYGAG